jgi:hypothetical protein
LKERTFELTERSVLPCYSDALYLRRRVCSANIKAGLEQSSGATKVVLGEIFEFVVSELGLSWYPCETVAAAGLIKTQLMRYRPSDILSLTP